MINLYSGSKNPVKEGMNRLFGGMKEKVTDTIGGSAFENSFEEKTGISKDMLNQAVQTFGDDLVRDWQNKSGEVLTSIKTELRDMKQQATQARMANDMERYKIATQRSLFYKKLLQDAKLLDEAQKWGILTAMIGGASGALGNWAGSERGQEFMDRIKK